MIVKLKSMQTNFSRVETERMIMYFSYETCVAFSVRGKLTVCENCFSKTTGKHLNLISDNKSIRISKEDFDKALEEALKGAK